MNNPPDHGSLTGPANDDVLSADPDWSGLQVFFGDLTGHAAKVYARFAPDSERAQCWTEDLELAGVASGPHCDSSRTLPATVPFHFLGSAPTPLAAAQIPDPTWWSPELPARYHLQLQIKQRGSVIAECRRTLGLRRFSTRGASLLNDGRRTVIRAAPALPANAMAPEDWQAAMLHQVLAATPSNAAGAAKNGGALLTATDQRLEWLSKKGVPALVLLADVAPQQAIRELERLSRHCAVSAVLLDRSVAESLTSERWLSSAGVACGNLLLAAETQTSLAALRVVAVDADSAVNSPDATLTDRPCLVVARSTDPLVQSLVGQSPAEVTHWRRAVEALQSRTAGVNFAGYVILS